METPQGFPITNKEVISSFPHKKILWTSPEILSGLTEDCMKFLTNKGLQLKDSPRL